MKYLQTFNYVYGCPSLECIQMKTIYMWFIVKTYTNHVKSVFIRYEGIFYDLSTPVFLLPLVPIDSSITELKKIVCRHLTKVAKRSNLN